MLTSLIDTLFIKTVNSGKYKCHVFLNLNGERVNCVKNMCIRNMYSLKYSRSLK